MIFVIALCASTFLFEQTAILNESFSNIEFPPPGWDTLHSDTLMHNWYRFNYTGPSGPDSFQARVRVYDASDTLRTGWSTLKTPNLDLYNAAGVESLYFWYRFSQAFNNLGIDDTMYIDITDNDVNWHNLLKIGQGADTNAWQNAHIDMSPYNTYTNARIRFLYVDQPNDSLNQWNCNFWLDSVKVISFLIDSVPPTIVNTVPANADTGVGTSSNILIYFSEPIDTQTIIPGAFDVQGVVSGQHLGSLSYDSLNYIVYFNPDVNFSFTETVYVIVYDTIRDLAGNQLDGDNNGSPSGNYPFWFCTVSSPDTIAPDPVFDLDCIDIGTDYVMLQWTAPGDDGNIGQASYYDIRYAEFLITEANFYSASECSAEPPPSSAGQVDSFTVQELASQTQYYFALKTADEDTNWSGISNVPTCTTALPPDTLLLLNEFIVDPESFDHNNNGNYSDEDEEYIEVFNKNDVSSDISNYQLQDLIGANTLAIPTGFAMPAQSYLLVYASGEFYIIDADIDTVASGSWTGTWPDLDQSGDTVILVDAVSREIDRKSYVGSDVIPDYSIARLPNGSQTWISNAFPSPGTNNGQQYILPISYAFQDIDSNFVPDLLDSVVTITGVVTAPPGIFADIEAYIQDSTGGVNLFGDFNDSLDYRDSIVVTGTVDQYRGKSELTDFTYSLIQHNATIPTPINIDASTLNTEMYEGSLVRIKVACIDALVFEGNENYNAWDTLNTPFIIRIDSYTNIPGSFAPLDTFTLIGIKGQYTYSSPPDDGYQLLPRATTDFSHLYEPIIYDIKEIQTPGNDGVSSKYVDSIVTAQGIITGPNYVFTSGSPCFYIQDTTGGINVYDADGDQDFYDYIDSLGACIRVVGTITEYNGLTEIAHGYAWFLSMDTVPLPKQLSSSRFLTENMEGSLIEFKGVIKTPPYKTGAGYNIEVLNGDVGITVRFTTATLINPLSICKDDERVFTGIVGQYDPDEPHTSGYQVLLRSASDIRAPDFDSASAEPLLYITGPKTFIPSIGEQTEIRINAPIDYRLDLTIHDMNFRCLKNLYSGAGGSRTLYWDGKDDYSRACKIGIYLLSLKATASNAKSKTLRTLIVIGTQF